MKRSTVFFSTFLVASGFLLFLSLGSRGELETVRANSSDINQNDSIFTYLVPAEDKKWVSWNPDGSKIYPEEFLRNNPNANEREIQKAKEVQEYNEWHKDHEGEIWHEVLKDTIENGKLGNTLIDRGLCNVVKRAWQNSANEHMSYDTFVSRMKKQTGLINAELTNVPLVRYGYVSYHFRDKNLKVHKRLTSAPRAQYISSMLRLEDQEDLNKYSEQERVFLSKILPHSKRFYNQVGSGERWSPDAMSWGIRLESEEKGTFRVNVPLSIEAFNNFYKKNALQEPPEYFVRLFESSLNEQRERAIYDKVKGLAYTRNLSQEKLDERRTFYEKEISPNYIGDIEFIKSERRVEFRAAFALPSGIKNNPNRTH